MSYRKMLEIIAIAATLAATPSVCQERTNSPEEPIRTLPAEVGPDAKSAIEGINAFSLDLYRSTLRAEENHFLSPASVSVAVALAYRGARGTTADELEKTLHFGRPPAGYLRANGQVLETMAFAGPLRELRTANAIWLQEGMPLNPEYEQDVATFAKAGFKRVEFRGDPDAARRAVNGWVAESTRDKITDLLEQEDVTQTTRAILVNAIYWKGAWASAFDTHQTKLGPSRF